MVELTLTLKEAQSLKEALGLALTYDPDPDMGTTPVEVN